MAAADDDDVEGVRAGNHGGTSIPELRNPEAGSLPEPLFHVKQVPTEAQNVSRETGH
jgi:hypothetical protein